MGVLDKLMFWKKDTVELDYEVEGCFTLPSDGSEAVAAVDLNTITSTPTSTSADAAAPAATTPDDTPTDRC